MRMPHSRATWAESSILKMPEGAGIPETEPGAGKRPKPTGQTQKAKGAGVSWKQGPGCGGRSTYTQGYGEGWRLCAECITGPNKWQVIPWSHRPPECRVSLCTVVGYLGSLRRGPCQPLLLLWGSHNHSEALGGSELWPQLLFQGHPHLHSHPCHFHQQFPSPKELLAILSHLSQHSPI